MDASSADGLAESSRNQRLNDAERTQALALSRTLFGLRDGKFNSAEDASKALDASDGVRVDYLTVVDPQTLKPVDVNARPALALVASVITHDPQLAREYALGIAAHHVRRRLIRHGRR